MEDPAHLLLRRYIGLNRLGCELEARDGHIWIESVNDDDEPVLHLILRKAGISLNNKIYGGILQALDTIDEALDRAKHASLTACAEEGGPRFFSYFMGEPGIDYSRIDVHEPGVGGLV